MSDKLKEDLKFFLETGVFIPTKTYTITGSIDEDLYDSAAKKLHALDSTHGEVTIMLNSDGGCLTSGKAIYDLIAGMKNRVTIIVYGEACSAATLVLQAADHRVMAENSKLMIHVGSESIPHDHPRNVDRVYEQHRIDESWIQDTYLNRIKEKKPRFTRSKLSDILIFDKYLSPKESLELGLIDNIGEYS